MFLVSLRVLIVLDMSFGTTGAVSARLHKDGDALSGASAAPAFSGTNAAAEGSDDTAYGDSGARVHTAETDDLKTEECDGCEDGSSLDEGMRDAAEKGRA